MFRRLFVAVAFLFFAGCPGATTAADSGVNPDAGCDAGSPIPCTLTNDTGCTLDGGGSGVCCDGVCVQTENDSANCNRCGQVCPAPSACQNSTCQVGTIQGNCRDGGCAPGFACAGGYFCAALTCPAGELGGLCPLANGDGGTCCSGDCADRDLDDHNCGQCGQACADGGFCLGGLCNANPDCNKVNAGAQCRLTETSVGSCCGGICIDLGTAAESCGLCGSGCPLGGACAGGECADTDAGEVADGGAFACGDGGGACAEGSSCVGGRCLAEACASAEPGELCGFGEDGGIGRGLCCGGSCTDPSTDPRNCGACGHVCSSGFCNAGCLASGADGGTDGGPDGGPADAGGGPG